MNTDELIAILEADAQRMTTQATQLEVQAEQAATQAAQLRGAADYARSAVALIKEQKGKDNVGA